MGNRLKKVLVVDDDPTTLAILGRSLENLGFAPIVCASPSVALQIAQENGPWEIVVSDYQMPAMTGDVFLSELRKLLPDSNHATIMTSGIISLPKISELLQDGVDYFLPKPINLREFSEYINRVTLSKQSEKASTDNRATV